MRKVKVGTLISGKGMPKIAIPLTGERLPALYEELEYVRLCLPICWSGGRITISGTCWKCPSLLRENGRKASALVRYVHAKREDRPR